MPTISEIDQYLCKVKNTIIRLRTQLDEFITLDDLRDCHDVDDFDSWLETLESNCKYYFTPNWCFEVHENGDIDVSWLYIESTMIYGIPSEHARTFLNSEYEFKFSENFVRFKYDPVVDLTPELKFQLSLLDSHDVIQLLEDITGALDKESPVEV